MAQKLAIIISGAVSLGSYEAGVMFEIIDAIRQHNRNPETPELDRIVIDVITGASAGGMTGAILTQKLLFEAATLNDPYSNHLYQPWVQDVDIMELLDENLGDEPSLSLLSSNYVGKIADKYLLGRYATQQGVPVDKHPAAADTIHLGLAMSNLNGYDCSVSVTDEDKLSEGLPLLESGDRFTYTRHQDRFVRTAETSLDKKEFWKDVALAARACGAFPFAFRALAITRKHDEDPYCEIADDFSSPETPFVYTDGGVFQNEPIGMAKLLVDRIDPAREDTENRFYLYVSPSSKLSSKAQQFVAGKATMFNMAMRLVGSIFTQARFQDWMTSRNINQQIDLLDKRAEGLMDVIRNNEQALNQFKSISAILLEAMYDAEPAGVQERAEDFERLKKQYKKEFDQMIQLSDQHAEVWLKTVQILEKAAELGKKDKMKIYSITASADELAGEKIQAFGGFLDRRFRDFDYDVGRNKAISFLKSLKNHFNSGNQLKALRLYNFETNTVERTHDPKLARADLSMVDEKIRLKLKSRIIVRAKDSIKSLNLGFFARFFAKLGIGAMLGGFLDKMLKLEVHVDDEEDSF